MIYEACCPVEVQQALPLPVMGVAVTGWSVAALVALAAQITAVRPFRHRRTAEVLAGGAGERRSHAHLAHIGLEVVKVVALLGAGVTLLSD